MFNCPNFRGLYMFIYIIDGNVEHNKLAALNILNILPNDWDTIKINTDLFTKTGVGSSSSSSSSTYRFNTRKWNQVVSTLIKGTKKEVTIICNYSANSGHCSKATFNFTCSELAVVNISRDDMYKNFRLESSDVPTLNISSCLWSRIYSCILNWERRTELVYSRQLSSSHADVQTAANTGDAATRKSKRQKQGTELPPEHKTYIDVLNHINSLQDPHPLRDIFGTSYSDSGADVIFDDIEAEVDEDIEHAANSV